MRRVVIVLFAVVMLVLGLVGPATGVGAAPVSRGERGAPGLGDPYFPLDGNGGYDVSHYNLSVDYRPATDLLRGTARITARASQRLDRFDLDLQGLHVDSIRISHRRVTWTRSGQELRISLEPFLQEGEVFTVVVRYHGVPQTLDEAALGQAGFFPTADGGIVIGEPHVAATWFPVNDHPLDKATYRVRVRVPRGLEAVSNGYLAETRDRHNSTSWTWVMDRPMASYLATATIGQFDLKARRTGKIRIWDAIHPALYRQPAPRTGTRFAASGGDLSTYKRLTRSISVPAGGGSLQFGADRSSLADWDYFAVEARPAGSQT